MELIAVGGGIGSGKSVFCEALKKAGAKVISADQVNADLMQEAEYLVGLARIFPTAFRGGQPDKREIRNLIFQNPHLRESLNAYAHPAIMKEIFQRAAAFGGTVFVEIPLLMEGDFYRYFSKVIVVWASDEIRIERIMERNGISRESAVSMMNAQAKERDACKVATDVVMNDKDRENLVSEALRLYAKYAG